MKKTELINLLNKDLADEHAAIIRYLVHGWLEGEDTPIGAVSYPDRGKRCGTCSDA
jgi:bacterioferritin